MSSNSVCNHTRDKQIGLPLRGRPILLSLVWLQTELDSTQSYYHYLFRISCWPRRVAEKEYKEFGGAEHYIISIKVEKKKLVWKKVRQKDRNAMHCNYHYSMKPIFIVHSFRGGLMVSALAPLSALDSGASGPGSSPDRGHCVVFLGNTLYSHGASRQTGV